MPDKFFPPLSTGGPRGVTLPPVIYGGTEGGKPSPVIYGGTEGGKPEGGYPHMPSIVT